MKVWALQIPSLSGVQGAVRDQASIGIQLIDVASVPLLSISLPGFCVANLRLL